MSEDVVNTAIFFRKNSRKHGKNEQCYHNLMAKVEGSSLIYETSSVSFWCFGILVWNFEGFFVNCHLMLPGPKGVAKSAFQLRGRTRNIQKRPEVALLVTRSC